MKFTLLIFHGISHNNKTWNTTQLIVTLYKTCAKPNSIRSTQLLLSSSFVHCRLYHIKHQHETKKSSMRKFLSANILDSWWISWLVGTRFSFGRVLVPAKLQGTSFKTNFTEKPNRWLIFIGISWQMPQASRNPLKFHFHNMDFSDSLHISNRPTKYLINKSHGHTATRNNPSFR